jgi:hypothetical protein
MQAEDFVRILRTFADRPEDIDLSKGTLLFQVFEEVLEVEVNQRGGELWIREGGADSRAAEWIIRRIARVEMLADRILSYTSEPDNFVTPSAQLLEQLDFTSGADVLTPDATQAANQVLARRPAGTSTILYLTSDAGEGKTTLINHMARQQATAYKERKVDWLLVPIPLGGRGFLRFDDVVVAALANKLRFQRWYFEAFLELVRLGVVVPAFDGFEEMFVEGSSGDALSALGNLMRNLHSSGSALVAARKAYFEYQSFRTQAKLFDTIGAESVSFARLALNRWGKSEFLSYASKRKVPDPSSIFEVVSNRLSPDHPLLTRPILVRRLLDVMEGQSDLNALVEQLGKRPEDYFYQFVTAIVDREANEKWLDKSGEIYRPLLSVDEHHSLLSAVAQEMWLSSTDALKSEVLDVIADLFAESITKDPALGRQIRERLKHHSLIVSAESVRGAFSFDHEDFRKFFLGEAIGRLLLKESRAELQSILGVALLPKETCEHAIRFFQRGKGRAMAAIKLVQQLSQAELPTSFARENAGALVVWLLDGGFIVPICIEDMALPADALVAKSFQNTKFENCYFQPTSLNGSRLTKCEFQKCQFDRLEVSSKPTVDQVILSDCTVGSLVKASEDEQLFEPAAIERALCGYGFQVRAMSDKDSPQYAAASEEEIRLVERVLRIFLRATHVNQSVIQLRLGHKAGIFLSNVLPSLLRVKVLEEVPYLGKGTQRRFRLRVPMEQIQLALNRSNGRFSEFLDEIGRLGSN